MAKKSRILRRVEKTDQQWDFSGIPRTGRHSLPHSYWFGTDTEELFEKNKPDGWTKESVTYVTNSYGYRSMEFINDDKFTVASFWL